LRWLASQLPVWAARCASADGSADDTTVALLISPAGQTANGVAAPGGSAGSTAVDPDSDSDEITIPAVIRTDTAPSGWPVSGEQVSAGAEQVTTEQTTTEQTTTEQTTA